MNKIMNKSPSVRVRKATLKDAAFLLALRNDPDVRRQFIDTSTVKLPNHIRWLTAVLNDADRVLLVGMNASKRPIGQIRFDVARGVSDISLSIAKPFRGKGYGVQMVLKGMLFMKKRFQGVRVKAKIKRKNMASIITFERAGFVRYAGSKDFIFLQRTV